MILKPEQIIFDFAEALGRDVFIEHESQLAPHKGHKLPSGKCAVYIFSLRAAYGQQIPAGAHRVLKVG